MPSDRWIDARHLRPLPNVPGWPSGPALLAAALTVLSVPILLLGGCATGGSGGGAGPSGGGIDLSAFEAVNRYVPEAEIDGQAGSMAASHHDQELIAFTTGNSTLNCWRPKTDELIASTTVGGNAFVEEIAEEPVGRRDFATRVMWVVTTEISGAASTNQAVPFDTNCDLKSADAVVLPSPSGSPGVLRVDGYDIDPAGNHYALLQEASRPGNPGAWLVARYDASAGSWTTRTITPAPSAWSNTQTPDGVRLSYDAASGAEEVVIGNGEQVRLDPVSLSRVGTRSLRVPSGFEVRDFVAWNGQTVAAIDRTSGAGARVVLFEPSGSLDATDAEVDFTFVDQLVAIKETAEAGSTPASACGEFLKFEVLGIRSNVADPGDHRVHQFWATTGPCDPTANGDPGF